MDTKYCVYAGRLVVRGGKELIMQCVTLALAQNLIYPLRKVSPFSQHEITIFFGRCERNSECQTFLKLNFIVKLAICVALGTHDPQ